MVVQMSLGGFLLLYLACMVVLVVVLARACEQLQRQGRLGAAWVMVGLTFIPVAAHWTWPFLLAGAGT